MLAHLIEVGDKRDGDDFFVAGFQIEQPQIGAASVDDASVVERSRFDVEDVLMALLLARPWPSRIHGVDVHDAVAVERK